MVKIALIVLNYKQTQLTIDTLHSLLQINHKGFDYQIFLINNNPPDESLAIFEDKYGKNQKITILSSGANLGYAGGNNFGIKHALHLNYDYYLIINNDVIVDKNFLLNLYNTARLSKIPAVIGPKIYFAPGYEYHKDRYKKSEVGKVIWSAGGTMDWNNVYGSNQGVDEVDQGQHDKQITNLDFITGCCFLVPKEIFLAVGPFDEKYFMYLEDVDFCQRVKKKGYQLIYEPKAFIWHVNSGSSGSGSALHDYFITRNRLMFGFKYASFRTRFALAREAIKMIFIGRQWQKIAVIDYYVKHLGKGSWK